MAIPNTDPTAAILLALCATLTLARVAAAQEPTPEQMRELVERHRAAAVPGPEHERLASLAGTWELQLSIRAEPGGEPTAASGTTHAEMILGGRFLLQRTQVDGGMLEGESVNLIGFDRRSGDYTILMADSTATYWVSARGPAAADGSIVMSGEDYDAIFGGTQIYDIVIDPVDPDRFETRIVFKDDVHTRGGEPFTMVESTSTRRR